MSIPRSLDLDQNLIYIGSPYTLLRIATVLGEVLSYTINELADTPETAEQNSLEPQVSKKNPLRFSQEDPAASNAVRNMDGVPVGHLDARMARGSPGLTTKPFARHK